MKYETLPGFDAVLFASSSAVESFHQNLSMGNLKGKDIVVIGKPTSDTLKRFKCGGNVILAKEATINASIESLAESLVKKNILNPR